MKIHGLQKLTLLDFPGRVACTVFLGGCDFRCPYCHNYELVDGQAPALMGEEELLAFLDKRKGLLDGVAITGGEPCLRPDLPDLIREIRARGFAVKLDTNGAHPKMLASLLQKGLVDYVAMDIKNSPAKYAVTVGLPDVDLVPVRESAAMLMDFAKDRRQDGGGFNFEFRTTVVREFHEASDFEQIGHWIQGAPQYFLQPFTDRETVPYENLHAPDKEEMEEFLRIAREYVPGAQIRGAD